MLIVDTILYLLKGISLPGVWTDWLIFFLWLIGTFVVTFGQIRKKWAKVYGSLLLIMTFLSLLPMGIPFLTVVAFAIDPLHNYIKLDSRIRLQENAKSVIAIPQVEAVKNYYLLERVIGETDFYFSVGDNNYRLEDVETVRRLTSGTDILEIEFRFKDGIVIKKFK